MSVRPALLLSFTLLAIPHTVAAQPAPAIRSELCTQKNAVETINQQVLASRTFDDAVTRIAVLIRAADLLWPYQEDKAMAIFNEAFELATQNYKEVGDAERRTSNSQFAARIEVPDQRHKVISALAKRNPLAASRLLDQIIQEDAKAAEEKSSSANSSRTGDKILSMARGLAAAQNPVSAMNFARTSFRYKATFYLPLFLFELAKTNNNAADRFYEEALNNYSSAPMDQFLFLSSYPFGNTREAGDMPGSASYPIPQGFNPNVTLQRMFVQRLLARVQSALLSPVDTGERYRPSDLAQMWLALTRLEKQIATNLPDIADSANQAKEKVFAVLTPTSQRSVSGTITRESQPKKNFDELIEAAEKQTDVATRDRDLTMAIIGSSKDETAERVVSLIDKISDSGIRESLTNWFYLFRAQALTKDKKFDEARKLAMKVDELDQRAYLFSQIAEGSLKEAEDQTQARELLNEIAAAGAKAPKTIATARALLALAYLYSKIDANRGIEELSNAVRVINAIEKPDFSLQFVMLKIEGKNFGSYASISTPGFNPETAFLEIGKLDFDGTLIQATTFADKGLKSLTTLSVIEPCLMPAAKSRKPAPKP
jgi:hypothetical protein